MGEIKILDHDPARWQPGVEVDLDTVLTEFKNGERTFMDSETCGLNSIMVLLQWAVDDGPVHLYSIWKEPVGKTKRIIEGMLGTCVVMFNSSFDWFHLNKLYTIWSLLPDDWIPEEHIEHIAQIEYEGHKQPVIKPRSTLDLLLHSRKGEFQTLMARNDIRIRRVPTAMAYALARELEGRVQLDNIYFAKAKDPDAPRWRVYDCKNRAGEIISDFKDVVLKFKPAGGLKYLAEYILGVRPPHHYSDIEVSRAMTPPDKKLGYIPWALGMAPGGAEDEWKIYDKKGKPRGYAWPYWVQVHIDHWHEKVNAREYAYYDVVYTRMLYEYFGRPQADDDDSVLACLVGVVRWRGFAIDVPGMIEKCKEAKQKVLNSPVNICSPKQVKEYLQEAFSDEEGAVLNQSTKKSVLTDFATSRDWLITQEKHGTDCTKCEGTGGRGEGDSCARCNGTGKNDANLPVQYNSFGGIECGNHPGSVRAWRLLQAKKAFKEVEIYEKLIRAGRFHPDFSVIGTLSTRMSGGSGGLNAQGIKHDKDVRKLFPLFDDGKILSGGDFDSFEVVLACTVYKDKDLRSVLVDKVEHKTCKHGTVCEHCEGTKKTKFGDCGFCQIEKEVNGKEVKISTGKYQCPTCGGKGWFRRKIHALFGTAMYPDCDYDAVRASDGTANDMYTKGKSGVFGLIYGGDWRTLKKNFGIADTVAQDAERRFFAMFPGIPNARQRIAQRFGSLHSRENGHIIWTPCEQYIESFLGFRRYFTLELSIIHALWNLAHKMPKGWLKNNRHIKVCRKGQRIQSAGGACQSALYGAAFAMQNAISRAAGNHEIQSPGGQICKHVQRRIWDLQPWGVNPLFVAPMNIHDEIMCVNEPEYVEPVAYAVKDAVESFRDRVPLIGMTWNLQQNSWAEKKGGSDTLKISPPEMSD